jgi:hypothetical protein
MCWLWTGHAMNLPAPEIRQRLIALHSDLGQSNGADRLDPLLELLAENGLSWSDWPELFALCGISSSQPKRLCRWVRGVHELMGRASTPGERRKARDGLIRRLGEENLSWTNDLPGILASEWRDSNPANPSPASPSAANDDVYVFDVVMAVIQSRVALSETLYAVASLWVLNTYVYDNFSHAPQLGIVAPASSCGKSTLRKVLGATAHNAWHSHNATPAAVYRELDRNPRTTMMFDEAENLDWSTDSKMRAVVDAAYESDGSIDRVDSKGNPFKVHVFAPVLWALRGSANDMPIAVLSRAFVIAMKKGRPRIRLPGRYFEDPDLIAARNLAEAWAANVQLNLDPEMPPELCRDPRLADNCRPLISIADSLGRGAEARAALIEFCAGLPSSDVRVQALEDCRKVWATRAEHLFTFGAFDRISKKALVAGLIEQNPFWGSWRGVRDKGQPHELTTGELSALLLGFGITTKTVWPLQRKSGDKSAPGWLLSQFERPWAEHCSEGDTPTQAKNIFRLKLHKKAAQDP